METKQLRTAMLPLTPVMVAGKATAFITIEPWYVCRPTLLVVNPTTAPHFLVDDLKVGNVSQLGSGGHVPAVCFPPPVDPENPPKPLVCDVVRVGMVLSVVVTNTDDAPHEFGGLVYADEVR